MQITEIKVFPIREEKLKAFVSIVLDECFMVNDIKVIKGKDGLFISMPSRRKKNGKFKDVAHPLNNETRQMMEQQILAEYDRLLGVESRKAVVVKEPAGDKPSAPPSEAEDSEEKTLDEVAEAHLRDSFWGT
jgi:stage V sporulation protein G